VSAGELYREALAAAARAHAPYSGLRVGAVLEEESGARHAGVNVEVASYRLTTCAEQGALARAVADGARRFRRIAVARSDGLPIVPCGGCRQALAEFAPDLTVVHATAAGVVERPLSALLPDPFELPR
jgi:cytidine deaminase